MSACVYVIETDAAVKIGISLDLEGRMRDFRYAGAHPLLVASFPMASRKHARLVEAWAHEELATDRLYGEWFKTHPLTAKDVVARIARRPPESMPLHPATRAAIRRWFQEAA